MPRVDEVAANWYSTVAASASLAQGDHLWDIEVFDARADASGTMSVDRMSLDLIILSQSCDLEHEKVGRVLTSPMYALADWVRVNPADLFRLEDIRRGYDPSLYLLPAWPDAPMEAARVDHLVDLSELRVVPLALLRSALDTGADRIALSSPAREHFSQAVARTFMRVGLPADIPSFELKRQSEEESVLTEFPVENAMQTMVRPLRIARRRYLRPGTGELYWVAVTKGQNPALMGAGRSEAAAIVSLSEQLALAGAKLAAGDTAWSWVQAYLPQ